MYTRCPKCGHSPLPREQALPAACPACGVILAKVGQEVVRSTAPQEDDEGAVAELLLTPEPSDRFTFAARAALLLAFAVWGLLLIAQDYRSGEIGQSFLHRPLLIFHEAGHVVFRIFGPWMMVLGGTLGQLLMPAILGGALLLKNRDPFGAAIGLWFFGVSLLDVAPYMYDALHPQLMLLSGSTGEAGGHDWIYLFNSMGLLGSAQRIGGFTHALGALVVLLSLLWAGMVLRIQSRTLDTGG